MRRVFLIAAAVILYAVTAAAQGSAVGMAEDEESFWQKRILSVDVVGVVTADTFLILNSSKLVPGELLSPGMTQDAIKGVFGLGLFSDVSVDGELD